MAGSQELQLKFAGNFSENLVAGSGRVVGGGGVALGWRCAAFCLEWRC